MRKVVVSMFVSLDGIMEEPGWTMPYWNDEIGKFKHAELFAADALLLGRVTYEGFAAAWPDATDEDGYADRMNRMPKYVASTTLQEARWNARFIKDDVAAEVARLKQQVGANILVFGSGQLVQTLLQHNLVDELRLLVYPVVLGSGKRLFHEGTAARLRLVDSFAFSSGVMALTYYPAPDETPDEAAGKEPSE